MLDRALTHTYTPRRSLTAGVRFGLGFALACAGPRAGDWPTYRHDNARSGITAERVSPPLSACWVFRARHAPEPAWGRPKPIPVEAILELPRVHFDDAFVVSVAAGRVYFGSSADNRVYCLDARTGKVRWTFVTDHRTWVSRLAAARMPSLAMSTPKNCADGRTQRARNTEGTVPSPQPASSTRNGWLRSAPRV